MSKPPVLSGNEVAKIIQPVFTRVINNAAIPADWNSAIRIIAKGFSAAHLECMQLQRDKDVEWCKQVRQDTAREIIKQAKAEVKFAIRQELLKIPSVGEQDGVAYNLGRRLELNFSKYLGEPQ